ncbi:uncharacterized protein [Oscarella lobularis]|uniref:uncharacterized protein n=1 Tax=Oscarella lobularis TaxID=121494 RepID=UPI0033142964
MICIILVAGHGALLEQEIKNDRTGHYEDLRGVPKALLPGVGGTKILDLWWAAINTRRQFSEVYLVTNADKYKYYERWATAHSFPIENIINDGTTTFENRLGSVVDFHLCLTNKQIDDDVMVVAGDMLFYANFDMAQVLDYFHLKKGNLGICYELEASESTKSRGIMELDSQNRITKFLEKPSEDETSSRLASVVFYCFCKESLPLVQTYLNYHEGQSDRVFGKFLEWFVSETTMYGMKLPTRFQLIGQVTLAEYEKQVQRLSALAQPLKERTQPISSTAFARVGLMGNPSDGFNGKTISLSIANFWAEVVVIESEKLVLTPHKINDPTQFGSLSDLHGISQKEGYLGGLRLLQATCKRFYQYCSEHGIALAKRNFTVSYETNVPRQVGLAGSSAIVAATLDCLIKFFGLNETDLPKPIRPQLILDAETRELFIQAGLQDRVIQVYEGLVYMDFDYKLMETQGHGFYESLDASDLPPLWLAYISDPSDSGRAHSDIRTRWNNGDADVLSAMKKFADYAVAAKEAIKKKDWLELGQLMDKNFDLRRELYGDDVVGKQNIEMIEIARKHGSSAKFPGSGGAVVGMCLNAQKQKELKEELRAKGFVFCEVKPHCH